MLILIPKNFTKLEEGATGRYEALFQLRCDAVEFNLGWTRCLK